MLTMNWTVNAQGQTVLAWNRQETAAVQTREFTTHYRKAARSGVRARRRLLRTLTTLAATAVVR